MSVQDAENEFVTVECSVLSTTFTPLRLRLWEHGGGKGAGKKCKSSRTGRRAMNVDCWACHRGYSRTPQHLWMPAVGPKSKAGIGALPLPADGIGRRGPH